MQAPTNGTSCAADKDFLISLKKVAKYISGKCHNINFQIYVSQCNRTERQDRNNDSFSALYESDDLEPLKS